MIVVAIIGILAAIAIPNFIRYQLRSKTSEAKTVMGGIKTSEESFRSEYDAYVLSAQRPGGGPRGVKADWGENVCPATCNRISISMAAGSTGLCNEYECIGYKPSGNVYYDYATLIVDPMAGTPEYATGAIADLDGDGVTGGFYYGTGNEPGLMGFSSAGPGDPLGVAALGAMLCTGGTAPASEVIDCDPQNF
jgi:type IV pilus assembly protein PilA